MHFWGHYIVNLLENMDHELWESKNVIYCYTNKINGKRYVGQTTQKLRKRHGQHMRAVELKSKHRDNCLPIHQTIRKYGIENFKLEILHIADRYSIDMLERHCIYFLDTLVKNKKGYNISSGGSNGNPLVGKTEEEINEWKRKISVAFKGKYVGENSWNYGKKMSQETKRKMSEARKGRFTGKNSPKSIPVVGIGIDNELFYESISETKNDDFHLDTISNHCKYHHNSETFFEKYKKSYKSYKGYKWYYREDYDNMSEEDIGVIRKKLEEEIKMKNRFQGIVAISIKDAEVLFFENTKQATKDDFSSSHIHKCCRGELKTHKGYKWYYREDYDNMSEEDIKLEISLVSHITPRTPKSVVGVFLEDNNKKLFYDFISQATKDGFDDSSISKCCKNKLKTHKGYKWYYKEDYDKMITETD